jgi:hypothetical protein
VPAELAMELQVVPAMRHKMGVVLPLYRMCKLKWTGQTPSQVTMSEVHSVACWCVVPV